MFTSEILGVGYSMASCVVVVMVVMVVTVCVGVVGVRGEAVLRDNGYEDVVVTIGEDVPEDARIIDNIKVQTKNLFVCFFLR